MNLLSSMNILHQSCICDPLCPPFCWRIVIIRCINVTIVLTDHDQFSSLVCHSEQMAIPNKSFGKTIAFARPANWGSLTWPIFSSELNPAAGWSNPHDLAFQIKAENPLRQGEIEKWTCGRTDRHCHLQNK